MSSAEMNVYDFRPLLAIDFDPLVNRFGQFWDGVIREFHLVWSGADQSNPSSAEIVVLAMEAGSPHRWKKVTFKALDVRDCYWEERWQGTIETWNLVLRCFDGWFYVAIGIEWDDFLMASSFTANTTRMFVRCRHLLHSVKDY
jgi:hypothetical protein